MQHFLDIHLLYTYIAASKKIEQQGVGKMRRNHTKYDSKDRLIQHAIEIFDLVDMDPDADAGEPIRRRFVRSSMPHVKHYDGTKRPVLYMAGNH